MHSYAAALSWRQLAAPTALLRNQIEHQARSAADPLEDVPAVRILDACHAPVPASLIAARTRW